MNSGILAPTTSRGFASAHRIIVLGGYIIGSCFSSWAADSASATLPPPAGRAVDFVKDIQPILSEHCYACHGPEKQKAELRWDNKATAFKTGEHGPVIVPGNSAASRVIKLVGGLEPDAVMPPRGERLTPAQIGLLRAWIDQGAIWVETLAGTPGSNRNHWA